MDFFYLKCNRLLEKVINIFYPKCEVILEAFMDIFVCIVTSSVKVCLKQLQTNLPAVLVTSCRTTDTLSS